MDEKPDFESTSEVLARRAPGLAWLPAILRERLTPAGLVSSVTALIACIAYVLNAQHTIHETQEGLRMQQSAITALEKDRELLHTMETQLAVMSSQLDSIATEVDRQREWRDHVEIEAESRPHARRH